MKKLFIAIALVLSTLSGQAQTETSSAPAVQTSSVGYQWNKFSQLVAKKQYKKAIEEGIKISVSLTENGKYKEAFAVCRDMDAAIRENEKETEKTNFELRYYVTKERLRMYTKMKRQEQSKALLNQLQSYIEQMPNNSLTEDWLLTQADFYQTFGMTDKSLACYKQLFQRRSAGKDLNGIEKCYKEMIAYAKESNNNALNYAMNKMYTAWQDSIASEKATLEFNALKKKLNDNLKLLDEKDSKITTNWAMIIVLAIICAILAGALFVLFGFQIKNIRQIKKLKQSLNLADENNEQKSKFIRNIGGQISPSLNAMENNLAASSVVKTHIVALKKLMDDIQTYAGLEEGREEHYALTETNVSTLCESIMERVRPTLPSQVETSLTVPKMSVKTNAEALERIVSYVMKATASQEGSEKVTLEFKKRSAHSGQFIITNHGSILPTEERADLFKAFAEVHDLTKDNGLGYPICSLIAYKLNGTLRLDDEFKRGTRFILELHDN